MVLSCLPITGELSGERGGYMAADLLTETGVDLAHLPPIATAKEVAALLQTSEASLAQDRYLGRGIPYIKHGRLVRYLRADVARYLAANRSEAR